MFGVIQDDIGGSSVSSGRSRPRSISYLLLVCILLAGVQVLAAPPAHGAESSVLLAAPGGQFQPAVLGTRMAWEENTRARPNRFKVYSGTGKLQDQGQPQGDQRRQRRDRRLTPRLSGVEAIKIRSLVLQSQDAPSELPPKGREHRLMGVLAFGVRRLALIRAAKPSRHSSHHSVQPRHEEKPRPR